MPKKVLFVITKSNWGGAQRYVFDLATSLPKDQFEVVVALGGTGQKGATVGALDQKLQAAGIQTIFVGSFMRNISLVKEFAAFFELFRIFKKEKPDIVHLNSSKAGGLGALAAQVAGVKKVIFTAHGWAFRENRNVFVRLVVWLASYITALLCDTVICVSDYDLKQARRMPGVRALRVYNGINSDVVFGSGDNIRSAFPPGVKITGTIGELNKNKNQQTLIEEAKNKPEMYVAIVGEGEERKSLEQKIKDYKLESRVKLFGFMPTTEVMKGFDVFALPSLKEGLPYVLLEAKAAGLPIVANRVGGVGEVLDAKDMRDFTLSEMVIKTVAVYSTPL
jgi:glycosyltransferase involved in cell wall biosynthesis